MTQFMSGRAGSGSTWGYVGSAQVWSTSRRVEVDVGMLFKTSCCRSLDLEKNLVFGQLWGKKQHRISLRQLWLRGGGGGCRPRTVCCFFFLLLFLFLSELLFGFIHQGFLFQILFFRLFVLDYDFRIFFRIRSILFLSQVFHSEQCHSENS